RGGRRGMDIGRARLRQTAIRSLKLLRPQTLSADPPPPRTSPRSARGESNTRRVGSSRRDAMAERDGEPDRALGPQRAPLPAPLRGRRTARAWPVSIELPLASSYTAVAYRSRDVGRRPPVDDDRDELHDEVEHGTARLRVHGVAEDLELDPCDVALSCSRSLLSSLS